MPGLWLSGYPSGGRVSPRWRQGTRPLTRYHCREGAGKQQQGRLLFPWRGSVGGSESVKRLSRHILTARTAVPVFHDPLDRQPPGLRERQVVKVVHGAMQVIQRPGNGVDLPVLFVNFLLAGLDPVFVICHTFRPGFFPGAVVFQDPAELVCPGRALLLINVSIQINREPDRLLDQIIRHYCHLPDPAGQMHY
nr:MAG TPA: hypothetical protein [Inoviridae sp.]